MSRRGSDLAVVASRRRQLDAALARFADAAVSGDAEGALRAFADAQSLMPDPRLVQAEALVWVEAETRLVQLLPATVEALEERQQLAAWGLARSRAAR